MLWLDNTKAILNNVCNPNFLLYISNINALSSINLLLWASYSNFYDGLRYLGIIYAMVGNLH
uniref:Uncharacterized protein n=1 Tax=Lepeophtheirus salmonis TaxID=72036 RepID=A0A0K2VC97_LEPSM